ncbi:MAG: hypothetical protein KDC12_14280 [Flavobacteriales bacterium]|nr:hypothetical protein [Flavobacteriales bacterium]
MSNRLLLILTTVVLTLGSWQCRKKNDQIPLVSVNITMNINEPQFFDLSAVGGWVYVTGGSRGIIVYRNNLNEFSAYDRHAPFNVDEECQVKVTEDNVIIEDPCSGSQWLIIDGSLLQGPAGRSLQSYSTTFSDPILHIYN